MVRTDGVAADEFGQGPGVTLGVEEEFLVVDAVDGRPVPWAERVLEGARAHAGSPAEVTYKAEFLTSQVETNTSTGVELYELAQQLLGAGGGPGGRPPPRAGAGGAPPPGRARSPRRRR
jgi:glutamate---cysteine ligase / carboxylate-amine ligase